MSPFDAARILDRIGAGVLVHGPDARIRYANASAGRLLGVEPGRLVGLTLGSDGLSLLKADRTEMPSQEGPVARVLKTAEPVMDLMVGVDRGPNSQDVWLNVSSFPETDEQGRVVCVVSQLTGMPQEHPSTQELREAHELLDGLLASMSDGFFVLDGDFVVRRFNRAAGELLGRDPAEVVGRPLLEVFPEAAGSMFEERYSRALREQTADAFEVRFDVEPYADWYSVRVYPLDGGISVYFQIISDRKEAEVRLRESEKFADAIADTLPAVVYIYDLIGKRNVWVNRAHSESIGPSIGESPQSAERSDILACIHPDDREALKGRIERLSEAPDGVWEEVEYRYFDEWGRWRWLQDRACVFKRDATGRVVQVVGSAMDITERKEAELERLRMEDRLRESQRLESLGLLAGGLAHDFNNLLVGVLGNASMALQDLPMGSPVWEMVNNIRDSATRAAELTGQMLAYSGRGAFVVGMVDLSGAVREVMPLALTGVSRDLTLDADLAAKLPPVRGDESQLRQVVMNLISNAAESTPDGRGSVLVRTGTCSVDRAWLDRARLGLNLDPGTFVFLEVRDDGAGMDPATESRMFDPFFTTKFTGRGLGLAAVLGIVRGHDGAVRVDTAPGEGTTVTVILPVAEDAPPVEDAEEPLAGEALSEGGCILVADDEPSVLRILSRVLEHAGFTVTQASDGAEALEQFRRDPEGIRAVVLDLTMPEMGGDEVLRHVWLLREEMPVVLTSGYSSEEFEDRFGDDSGVFFLAKPFTPDDILQAVRQVIGRQ